jgi:hypothetical protein
MPNPASSSNASRAITDDFDELLGLLSLVAGGEPPSREWAVTYLNCRSRLLASEQSGMLPGFLYQCGTVDRFREFIFLYDPDVALRREFIGRMIGRARALSSTPPLSTGDRSPKPPASPSSWDF